MENVLLFVALLFRLHNPFFHTLLIPSVVVFAFCFHLQSSEAIHYPEKTTIDFPGVLVSEGNASA